MRFEITGGKVHNAHKVVVYGPEGIGKSTFAAQFPKPLFIDTEGSTKKLDVMRFPKPTSWQMLKDEIADVITYKPCETLVIDTADWAEQLCIEAVCSSHGKKGIEDFGYGNGYTFVAEEWGRFLNLLQEVIDVANINVVLTAHAIIRKFEQPNEMGAYDRYELKLGKRTTGQTAPITKEWADMVLFANYKTFSVAVDDKGKKHKAQGGQRVMYTNHHPCWDAKNRDGLQDELPFDYGQIKQIIETKLPIQKEQLSQSDKLDMTDNLNGDPVIYTSDPVEQDNDYDELPQALVDLMKTHKVTTKMIQQAVAIHGWFPPDMPVKDYPKEFIQDMLISQWDGLLNEIELPY